MKGINFKEKNGRWKGGRTKLPSGYVRVKCYDHPKRNSQNYVDEHRLVMEKKIGRLLRSEELVHHKNGIKHDNRPENLEIMSVSQHNKHHHLGVKRGSKWKDSLPFCVDCGERVSRHDAKRCRECYLNSFRKGGLNH